MAIKTKKARQNLHCRRSIIKKGKGHNTIHMHCLFDYIMFVLVVNDDDDKRRRRQLA